MLNTKYKYERKKQIKWNGKLLWVMNEWSIVLPLSWPMPTPKTKVNKILKQKWIKTRKLKNKTHSRSQFVGLDLAQPPDRETDQVIHWSPSKIWELKWTVLGKLQTVYRLKVFLLFMHLDHCAHLTKPNLHKLFIHIFIQIKIVCRKVQRISNIHKYLLHVGWHRKQEN